MNKPLLRRWEDDELEMSKNAAEEAAHREEFWQISPSSLHSLITEVQAWRKRFPDAGLLPDGTLIIQEG